ncbi:RNA polymerase, partial [Durham virus]
MEEYDDFEYDWFDQSAQDDWELEIGNKKLELGCLKNVDYNLDSPLISDTLENFSNFLIGLPYSPLFQTEYWEDCKAFINSRRRQEVPNHNQIHNWIGRYFAKSGGGVLLATELLELVNKHAQVTFTIPEAFFKCLKMRPACFKDKGQTFKEKELLQKFLETHICTLFLNHKSQELSCFHKIARVKVTQLQKLEGIDIRLSTIGDISIVGEFALINRTILIDKNIMLMIKDTMLARFQTLLTSIDRCDQKFSLHQVQNILKIYELGDNALARIGSQAYDGLKLLEPICNLRLTELARLHRPLIPSFPRFRDFVVQSIRDLAQVMPELVEIARIIRREVDPNIVIQVFGLFRHWGHPFIDYQEGLEKLHTQVTMQKEIDDNLAQALGSDLAYLVLRDQFRSKKKWFVDIDQLSKNHPLYVHVYNQTWPTPKQIADFGDNWHRLPLTTCFEIPDFLDPAVIYSDKSHSIQRSEILSHLKTNKYKKLPTRRVLTTFLETPARDWKEFLSRINDVGLDRESLCIGLRAKERELKRQGRFFALMSWELREYFVVTEYLIKEHFVPLFKGLTMADDMNGVIRKLLQSSSGQGLDNYDQISIANHLDYSKWNNHQRMESNRYVFEVMGKFLGYPNLIIRTHEFFSKSLIYFVNRPDLMCVIGDTVHPIGPTRVCWEGQAGGLEGLRQKGWSILNLLLIMRVGKLRNTSIKVLAQGDNQVLNMHYQIPSHRTQDELQVCIEEIVRNNNAIMQEVDRWTQRLGLIINQEETMQSADFLIYGKVPIYRGNVLLPEAKRWSRVNCVTNDQLPTFGNIMATVGSTALTVSHFSTSFRDPIILYNWLGNFARILLEMYSPIVNHPVTSLVQSPKDLESPQYLIAALYLDPSLGGISGMSLSRFMIRGFPDPITEGLSFWKKIFQFTEIPIVKDLALKFGNPKLSRFRVEDLPKLLEKPTSLNLPSSLSVHMLIRTEIKMILQRNVRQIKNEIIQDAITYTMRAEEHLLRFLCSIKPLFPRFLAEFKAGTYLGMTESLVGLYENSKTIRTKFLREKERDLDRLVQKAEIDGLIHLIYDFKNAQYLQVWDCSAQKADALRMISWGSKVIGSTVPHPLEMFDRDYDLTKTCRMCYRSNGKNYLTTFVKGAGLRLINNKGEYLPYLGSATKESTSLISPWERESKVPLVRRATRLRVAINWFVEPDSNLSASILNNLRSLTGGEVGTFSRGYRRTGSALHRFGSSRQSTGGYNALSPAVLSRLLTTTDTLSDLGDQNYDFMFQSSILFAQAVCADDVLNGEDRIIHHHLSCKLCLREIEEPTVESGLIYQPLDVSTNIKKWVPENTELLTETNTVELAVGNWDRLCGEEKSYHIGRAIGFVFGDFVYGVSVKVEESSLFPVTLRYKLCPTGFYSGVIDGIFRACSLHVTHRRSIALFKKPRETVAGSVLFVVSRLTTSSPFLTLIREGPLHNYLLRFGHKTPPSYPLNQADLGSILKQYLKGKLIHQLYRVSQYKPLSATVWIFADILGSEIAGPLLLSSELAPFVLKPVRTAAMSSRLRSLQELETNLRSKVIVKLGQEIKIPHYLCESEIRHAAKSITVEDSYSIAPELRFGPEVTGKVFGTVIEFSSAEQYVIFKMEVPRRTTPLISGLRTAQIATGSHYKIRTILRELDIQYRDALCGGDGSGGLTALLLRLNPYCRAIFNSLLDLQDYDLRGSKPSPPSAVAALYSGSTRCVNFTDCWENPSDLTKFQTWEYFKKLRAQHKLQLDLMIFDMENRDDQSSQIESLLEQNLHGLLELGGTLIFKSYGARLLAGGQKNPTLILGRHFEKVLICQTSFTSNFSSECYIVCLNLMHKQILPVSVNFPKILQFVKQTYAFSTYKKELLRAVDLKAYHMDSGIPPELTPSPTVEIESILEAAGFETGVSASLSVLLASGNLGSSEVFGLLSILCVQNLVQLTALHPDPPAIPSDNKLIKALSFLVGLVYWWSWVIEDFQVFKVIDLYFNEDILVHYLVLTSPKGYLKKIFFGTPAPGVTKRIRLRGKGSAVGSVIRCLSRTQPKQKKHNINLWTVLKKVNSQLTYDLIQSRTNVLGFWKSYYPA